MGGPEETSHPDWTPPTPQPSPHQGAREKRQAGKVIGSTAFRFKLAAWCPPSPKQKGPALRRALFKASDAFSDYEVAGGATGLPPSISGSSLAAACAPTMQQRTFSSRTFVAYVHSLSSISRMIDTPPARFQ